MPLRDSRPMIFVFEGEREGFRRRSAEQAAEEKEPIRVGVAVPRTLDVFVEDPGGAPLADADVGLERDGPWRMGGGGSR